jgi:adenosylcobinamide-GDP ribazoletransferase
LLALALGATSLDPFVISAVAIAALTATTGALHEDALGDVADGFGGGATRERKLEIMRDSRIGTYGAVALILALLVRVGAFAALIGASRGIPTFLAFVGIAAASRGFMVWIWGYLPPARAEGGLSRDHGVPEKSEANIAIGIAAVIGFFTLLPSLGVGRALFVLACGMLATAGWARLCHRQVGGHTGDVLGGGQQICEIALLLAAAIAI